MSFVTQLVVCMYLEIAAREPINKETVVLMGEYIWKFHNFE